LVPVTLDCLLVGDPDRVGSTWAMTALNYLNLAQRLVPDAAPPFGATQAPPLSGAHLMWTLPYALRRGQHLQEGEGAGQLRFPFAPNRWLVLRAAYDPAGGAPALAAWVIQSDLLTTPATPDASQYPNAAAPTETQQIGGSVALAAWTGPAGPQPPFLQAVGPGDISWAAAYDNVRNVFAFHDALPATAGTYSYAVTGWYADPASDPLFSLPTEDPTAWMAALSNKFDWAVGSTLQLQDAQQAQAAWQAWAAAHGLAAPAAGAPLPPQLAAALAAWTGWRSAHGVVEAQPSLPRQMLCHGLVAQIAWRGSGASYGSGAPGSGSAYPEVAIGNTATEAIAAWLAKTIVDRTRGAPSTIPVIERSIDAFQKGLLMELERDPARAEAQLHAAGFQSTFGGTHWSVVRPEASEAQQSFGGQPTIPLDAAQTTALSDLAARQAERDSDAALLVSEQAELFALLYKQRVLPRAAPTAIKRLLATAVAAITAAIRSGQGSLATMDTGLHQAGAALTGLLGNEYELRKVNAAGYGAPNDPVLLIAGAHADTKFDAPGTWDETDTLLCRVTGQTITGLTVDYPLAGQSAPRTLGAAELLAGVTLPAGQPIPKEAGDLWVELLLLDTGAAAFLARLYFSLRGAAPTAAGLQTLTQAIQRQQMAPWVAPEAAGASRQAAGEAAGLSGVLPSGVAVSWRTGQPWTPIYMDWKVNWLPSAADPAGQLADWALGPVDYAWSGTSVVPPATPIQFTGRSVLGAKIAQDLSRAFSQFESDPDYAGLDLEVRQALDNVAAQMARFDLLTQTIGGFSRQLLTRLIAPNQDPADPATRELLGQAPIGYRPVPGGTNYTGSQPFFPIRAGHLQVIDLWIVDAFGQILRGKDPNLGANAPIPAIVRAQSLTTPGDANASYAQLPPRITQAARLTLQLTDAADDTIPSNAADSTSPICGWIVPNHLDASVMVFATNGDALGAVIKVQKDTADGAAGSGLRWDAPPGSSLPLGAQPQFDNRHLQGFVRGLLAQGLAAGGTVLDDWLAHIDSSLWSMSPLGAPDRNISALLGPTLALVRARLVLELSGLPAYNQSWSDTGKFYVGADGAFAPLPPPLLEVSFPVRLGDTGFATNGVLGYCQADDYAKFYAVYGAGGQTAALIAAMRRGAVPHPGLATLLRRTAGGTSAPSAYVATGHKIGVKPDATPVMVTILVDPRGVIPFVSGLLPTGMVALPPGPVAEATRRMTASFRVGPLLTDPRAIAMPLPAEVRGDWAWVARTDVTGWGQRRTVAAQDAVARLPATPPRLSEGWLTLSGAFGRAIRS
jgi:hypothetical protein